MTTSTPPLALKAKDYKSEIKPIWCPGCGHFAVLSAVTKALAHLGLTKEQVALVSGIGCSSRLPAYIDSYGFHGVHAGGDGDGFSIGGNHFLHACRRNMDMTYIVMDNEVYGMTKGQASPTTAPDWVHSKMTPHGTGMRRFQPAAMALAAGATWIARGFSGDPTELTRLLVEAIQHPGFALLHVLSPCQTFRPEQRHWKEQVHPFADDLTDEPTEAARRIHGDDGMSVGLIYAQRLPVWQPRNEADVDMATLEEEFVV